MFNLMLNQELYFHKREHQFIEEIPAWNLSRSFRLKSLDGSDEAT